MRSRGFPPADDKGETQGDADHDAFEELLIDAWDAREVNDIGNEPKRNCAERRTPDGATSASKRNAADHHGRHRGQGVRKSQPGIAGESLCRDGKGPEVDKAPSDAITAKLYPAHVDAGMKSRHGVAADRKQSPPERIALQRRPETERDKDKDQRDRNAPHIARIEVAKRGVDGTARLRPEDQRHAEPDRAGGERDDER